jgi:hypothetical protein
MSTARTLQIYDFEPGELRFQKKIRDKPYHDILSELFISKYYFLSKVLNSQKNKGL